MVTDALLSIAGEVFFLNQRSSEARTEHRRVNFSTGFSVNRTMKLGRGHDSETKRKSDISSKQPDFYRFVSAFRGTFGGDRTQ